MRLRPVRLGDAVAVHGAKGAVLGTGTVAGVDADGFVLVTRRRDSGDAPGAADVRWRVPEPKVRRLRPAERARSTAPRDDDDDQGHWASALLCGCADLSVGDPARRPKSGRNTYSPFF